MKVNKLLGLLAVLTPMLAIADEASDHVERGTRFYNLQNWNGALKEYREAYTLDPKPETMWAIAQTQRLSGDCRAAILSYKAYVRGASAQGASVAEDFIEQCQADLDAHQRAVDEAAARQAARPVEPAPSNPVTAPPPVAKSRPADPSWVFDPLGDTLFVVGIGAFVGGGVYFLIGNSDMSATAQKTSYQAYDTAVDAARSEQHLGASAALGGVVLLGLATWRFHAVASDHDREPLTAFTPLIIPGGGVVSYGGRF
jgi:hypothetical protein